MRETTPPEATTLDQAVPPRRRGSPRWVVLAFLGVLAVLVVVNQMVSTGGPEVEWIENDLEAALGQVCDEQPRVFLYIYEPDDPTHKRNEREVFVRRWARQQLRHAVCCRIALGDDLDSVKVRQRFAYKGRPLFLLLDSSGVPVGRTEGAVDRRAFFTYIGKPAQDVAARRRAAQERPAEDD